MSESANDLISVSQIAMIAHTSSVSNSAELRVHREECTATRLRNENMFNEIRIDMKDLDTKMDQTAEKISDKMDIKHASLRIDMLAIKNGIDSSNKWIYMIVGGITLAGVLFNKVPMHFLGG